MGKDDDMNKNVRKYQQNASVKQEERLWIQNKLPDNYSHRDLMELRRVTCNNLMDNDDDLIKNVRKEQQKAKEQRNFLTLAT